MMALSCVACVLSAVTTANAEVRRMVCLLGGQQEVPANASTARGCGLFEIDTDANTVQYRIVYSGLSSNEVAAHIHGFAMPGVNAGVKVALPAGTLKIGVWTYPEADEASILAGLAYVNIHSVNFGGGEIRGQIVDMVSFIDAQQENPVNASTASGFGLFMIDRTAKTLTYYIRYNGLVGAEVAAHIHGAANYRTNAGVVHPLPAGATKTGVWNYPAASEQAILDGMTYVNIHSTAFPGGEIRGQIVCSVNPLDRTQEVPPTNTSSNGCAFCGIDRNAKTLGYDIQLALAGSTEVAAHIHGFADAGVNAGVLNPLAAGARKIGVWNYPNAAAELGILQEKTYVNIHTNVFGGGEIRGQIRWCDNGFCPADFNGDGFLDFFDYDEYVTCYETGVCPPGKDADFNGDGFADFFDYDAYVGAFESGC
jgi:hypothetical protein